MIITEINVDLDGVLVDFQKKALEVAGIWPSDKPEEASLRRDFWKAIDRHIRDGNKFFEDMEPMSDAAELWEFVLSLDIPTYICSATGHLKGAAQEKRAYVRRVLGHEHADAARFVRDGHMKAQYAGDSVILIDDRPKVIKAWRDAGGIGVLHTDTKSTIETLKGLIDGL